MPIREFICLDCGHEQEHVMSQYDTEPPVCSHCDSSRMEKLFSATGGYHIKGNNSASVRPKGAGSRSKQVK